MSRPLKLSRSFVSASSRASPLGPGESKLLEALESNYMIDYSPSTTSVRIYLQSDVTDSLYERQALWNDVIPYIKQYGDSLGLQVCVVDMYHGMDLPAVQYETLPYLMEERGVYQLSLKEIQLSQETFSGPSLITLLGQKYGHRALQLCIPTNEYKLMCASLEEPVSKQTLQQYYQEDHNRVPPAYVLQLEQLVSNSLSQWSKTHSILSKAICKGAKIALGKEPTKVQSYVSSVAEDEITCGIFNCKSDHSQTCFWFKRVFTDLYDQRPNTDTALGQFCDLAEQKKGFNSEVIKSLNYLKEARLSARHIGLDSTNVFEFLLKWQRNVGLDVKGTVEHEQYVRSLCDKVKDVLVQKLCHFAEDVDVEMSCSVYQDVLRCAQHCRKLLNGMKERLEITDQISSYFKTVSHRPLILHGKSGSGKSILIVAAIRNTVEELKGCVFVTRFIGLTPSSMTIKKLLTSICEQVSLVYQYDVAIPSDYEKLVDHFAHVLQLSTKERPLCLFLDGVDKLSSDDGALGLSWLPLDLPENVHMVVSVSSETRYCSYPILRSLLKDNEQCFLEVPDLTPHECHDFLLHFVSQRNHTLTSEQDLIVSSTILPLCPSLSWLDCIANHISQWNSFSSTADIHRTLSNLNTYKGTLLSEIEEVETKNGTLFVCHTLEYITASKFGLSENELLDVLSQDKEVMTELESCKIFNFSLPLTDVPNILWSRLLHDLLRNLLIFKVAVGGVMTLQWKDRSLREVALEKYFSQCGRRISVSGVLADYFSGNMSQNIVSEIDDSPEIQSSQANLEVQSETHSETQFQAEAETSHLSCFKGRIISSQPLVMGNMMYNVRKMIELPYALMNSKRLSLLSEQLSDYQWWVAHNTMAMTDELITSLSYIIPKVPLKSQSTNMIELKLLQDAFQLSQQALKENPTQLSAELIGRLLTHLTNGDGDRPLLRNMLTEIDSPVLTPVHPYPHTSGGPLLISMDGHQGPITSISTELTPHDTLIIVSGSVDGTLRSWDCQGYGVIKAFDRHTDEVLSVSVSGNGQFVASCGKDKTVRFWLVSTAECLHTMRGHRDTVSAVVTTSKGHKVISGSLDCTIKVWNTEQTSQCKGELLFTLQSSPLVSRKGSSHTTSPVSSLALTSDDTRLAAGLLMGIVLVIDVVSGKTLHQLIMDPSVDKPIDSLALIQSNGSNYMYIMAVSNGMVTTLDCSTGLQLTSPSPCITKLEGKLAVDTMDSKNQTRFIDSVSKLITDVSSSIVSFAKLGDLAVIGSNNGSLHVWDLKNPALLRNSNHLPVASVRSLAYSPCGNFILSASEEPKIVVWHSEDLVAPMTVLDQLTSGVTTLYPLSDSIHFLAANEDGSVTLWNRRNQTVEREFKGHSSCVTCLDITRTEDLLMSGDSEGFVLVWNLQQGKRLRSFKEHSSELIAVSFYQQQYLISADKEGTISIKDFRTAVVLYDSVAYKSELCALLAGRVRYFDAVAAGYRNGMVKIWKLPSMKSICSLAGHSGAITSIKFISNDIDVIGCLTTSMDNSIRMWNIKTTQCISVLVTDYPVITASLNPSSKLTTLVYGSQNGYVGVLWYDFMQNNHDKGDNVLLKMLTSSNSEQHLSSNKEDDHTLGESLLS